MATDMAIALEEKTPFYRIKCVFFILVSIGIVYVILFMTLPQFIQNWKLLQEASLVVALSPWAIPAAMATTVFLILAWALVLRLIDKDTGKHYERTVHVAIILSIVTIVVRLPMGFILDGYLTSKNYSYCYWYTPPANFSSPVWVSKPQFCIEQTGHIRKMLVEWLQAQPNGGRDLSLLDVQQKVAELNAAHKAGEFVY
ncbi:hypothetical protein QWY82_08150 [Simiduia curdlanivorans]|uniref:DUF1240 domain-containing protein n=1 Tax=Simiduia curdlanivorans TaxID=1492769 RepID=A0ABV8V8D8_9GAMM|nr:hypothetical protein [Simiduia curdlanivorans]MDN3638776.1 hypothetical protein [Simiduia curdlanivorans]